MNKTISKDYIVALIKINLIYLKIKGSNRQVKHSRSILLSLLYRNSETVLSNVCVICFFSLKYKKQKMCALTLSNYKSKLNKKENKTIFTQLSYYIEYLF
jgi:hypothetical protein